MDIESPGSDSRSQAARFRVSVEHDPFVAACVRHGMEPERAEALWSDLVGLPVPPVPRRLPRVGLAIVVAGTLVLSAAGIWWATLVTSAAGAPGLLALATAWVVAAVLAAELAHRREIPLLDALFSVVAVAYATVATATIVYLVGGSSFAAHWWGRFPIELALLGAGGWPYGATGARR